jgi:tetratricopeptide (TPR) repeat protein
LSSHQQSLLAAALRNDEFVPFEKFAQSMAYLDSGEEAALAFAQVATMVAFLQHRSSDEVFPILMDRLRSGEEAETAVASLAGFASFEEFTVEWKQYVAGLPLISEQLLALPVVLDGEGSEFSDDPLLHNRLDLAKFVRLGDLLMEAQRPKAALIEYEKAKDGSQPVSPSVLVRKSLCHLQLGQPQQALDIAEQAVKIYPEHSVILTTLAALYEQLDREDLALLYWQRAHELNPYEIATQEALIRLYQLRDEADLAQKHMSYAQILSRGGAFTAPTQSPTKHGESNAQ